MILNVPVRDAPYDVLIQEGILSQAGPALKERLPVKKWMVITDENVDALYGDRVMSSLEEAGLCACRLALPPGERTKSLAMLERVYQGLCETGITRSDGILALGGGVIGDLAGFAAATYLRGVPYVQAPTTLLAQVDSAVGGKVAVDLPQGKNLVGSFYQPRCVLLDTTALDTLSDRQFADGMGEVIKYGCIRDAALFKLLTENPGRAAIKPYLPKIIEKCLSIKAQIVGADERDTGERMLLNFGHTLGHAIEALQHFSGYSHGEAVAVGMHLITRLSEAAGLTPAGTAETIRACLMAHGLPYSVHLKEPARLREAIRMDKKNLNGALQAVVLERIGQARLYKAGPEFFEGVEAWLM